MSQAAHLTPREGRKLLYTTLKLIHILLAITAVGFNLSYTVWLMRSQKLPKEITTFALRGVKFMDDRIANPAYALLLVSGLLMVFTGPWQLTTRWIEIAIGAFVVLVLVGGLGYTPALRNQIRALESDGPNSQAYLAASRRQTIFAIALAPVVVFILYLMVFKPFS
ncbi:MAG: DUF2269 family protein [Candidatus Dormibacteraeota bacterium]|nr:DUF2269 family protein [Candidatus Dormibacteraeota bacterium]